MRQSHLKSLCQPEKKLYIIQNIVQCGNTHILISIHEYFVTHDSRIFLNNIDNLRSDNMFVYQGKTNALCTARKKAKHSIHGSSHRFYAINYQYWDHTVCGVYVLLFEYPNPHPYYHPHPNLPQTLQVTLTLHSSLITCKQLREYD